METGNGTRDCEDMSIPPISPRAPADRERERERERDREMMMVVSRGDP